MQKLTNVNDRFTQVFAIDEIKFNAHHEYKINLTEEKQGGRCAESCTFAHIKFQEGPIKESGINGCHNEDLIAIVIDRLQSFQNSEYKCRENAIAITKLEEALLWLGKRTAERQRRGIEGTYTV